MVINGKRCRALVDNQATLNIMSLGFAEIAGLRLRPDCTPFRLSDGSVCHAVGLVRVHYKAAKDVHKSRRSLDSHQDFYVLPKVVAPIVLGLPFLREISIWPKSSAIYGTILLPNSPHCRIPSHTSPNNPSFIRWCLRIYLRCDFCTVTEAIALPDTGAFTNMMSLHYAKKAGYHIDNSPNKQFCFIMGNRQPILSSGKVKTTLTFSRKPPSSAGILVSFAVVHGLPVDVILCNRFLMKQDTFDAMKTELEWVRVVDEVAGFHCGGGPRVKRHIFKSSQYSSARRLRWILYTPTNDRDTDIENTNESAGQRKINENYTAGSRGDIVPGSFPRFRPPPNQPALQARNDGLQQPHAAEAEMHGAVDENDLEVNPALEPHLDQVLHEAAADKYKAHAEPQKNLDAPPQESVPNNAANGGADPSTTTSSRTHGSPPAPPPGPSLNSQSTSTRGSGIAANGVASSNTSISANPSPPSSEPGGFRRFAHGVKTRVTGKHESKKDPKDTKEP